MIRFWVKKSHRKLFYEKLGKDSSNRSQCLPVFEGCSGDPVDPDPRTLQGKRGSTGTGLAAPLIPGPLKKSFTLRTGLS